MSRSTRTTVRTEIGGSNVAGTFYRSPRRQHHAPKAQREIDAQLIEMFTEGDAELAYFRRVTR